MRQSDYLVDIGPKAGIHGGNVIAAGTPQEVMENDRSITGQYLSGKKKIEVPQNIQELAQSQTQKKEVSQPEDNDYWQRQAEVLIKGFIPVKYIININSPEILD